MKNTFLVAILAALMIVTIGIANDTPNFCIKNKSDRYIQFNVSKQNTGFLYVGKAKWIKPGADFCDFIPNIDTLSVIHIDYCDSKNIQCTNNHLLQFKATFNNLKANKVDKILLKFKVDENNNLSLMPQEGVLKGLIGSTKVKRFGKTHTINLKHNIGENNIEQIVPVP